jgi:hypothetical protein
MSPHIAIHFEFGFTIGGKPSKKVRIGNAPRDLDQPPPVPRKDTIKRRSGHTPYAHVHRSRAQPPPQQQQQLPQHPQNAYHAQQQHHHAQQYMQMSMSRSQPNLPLPPQHPTTTRPHVTITIPNTNAGLRPGHAQPPPHAPVHPRSRRHRDPQHPHHYLHHIHHHQSRQQHDARAARGRSAPPDAYHVSNWISNATVRAVDAVPPVPRRHTPLDEIPVMRFRLGDPDMPWTPRPEFGEDEGDESDDEFFATRRASAIYGARPETELRLISRHSAPMVLTADSLITDGEREPPSRHLTALQDAMMTVDGGFGFLDDDGGAGEGAARDDRRRSLALDLANVPLTALSQDVATSLAMWNQDHRLIMGTARERAVTHSDSQRSRASQAPQRSTRAPWDARPDEGEADDVEASRDTVTLGLVSPISSMGEYPPARLDIPRAASAAPTVSAA